MLGSHTAAKRLVTAFATAAAWLFNGACAYFPVDNIDAPQDIGRDLQYEINGARVSTEEGVDDAVWLEVPRPNQPADAGGEPTPHIANDTHNHKAGYVGGYLSQADANGAPLLIVLPGASSYYADGMVAKVRDYHRRFCAWMRQAGFVTWTLAVRECGTPYGGGDLDDVLTVLDWLADGGAAALGADRIYLLGYSSGATAAVLANERRTIQAVVAVDGITGPLQFQRNWGLYRAVADMFPRNTGMCQLGSTLDAYGPPADPAWDALDTVSRAADLRSPMLVMHGEQDFVFLPDNARNLQAACESLLNHGIALPEVQFTYLPTGTHFEPLEREDVAEQIIDFLNRH
jgi:pimeloyl-ACP methyl ester carboxylesterase